MASTFWTHPAPPPHLGGAIPGETKVASIAIYEYVETMQYREGLLLSLTLLGISYVVLLLFNYLNRAD